jgi:hypothetical protein
MTLPRAATAAVAAGFGLAAQLRRAAALHPLGAATPATVHRHGLARPTGVPWLDEPGVDQALVRFSRAVGLPPPLPDVHGLGIRVIGTDGPKDLLLSTTLRGRLVRHVLRPARAPRSATYTCLVPFDTPSGPLMVGARPEGEAFALEVAGRGEPWRRFARLVVAAPEQAPERHEDLDLDPVLHPVPGLRMPEWLADLRGPAYAASRRGRRRAGSAGRSGSGAGRA